MSRKCRPSTQRQQLRSHAKPHDHVQIATAQSPQLHAQHETAQQSPLEDIPLPEQKDGKRPIRKMITAVLKRIGFHLAVFLVAVALADHLDTWDHMGLYLGLVCLFARNISIKPLWIFPFSMGIVQIIIGVVLGLPLYSAIFLGGVQTWLQRLFMLRFRMMTEWVAAFFMLIIFSESLLIQNAPVMVPILFGALTLLGAGYTFIYKKRTQPKPTPQDVQRTVALDAGITASIESVSLEAEKLPANIQSHVQAIISSAYNIIQCMQEDPRDRERGEKFLQRYIPATHSVLEKYAQLAFHAPENERTQALLAQSEDLLNNLKKAFAEEHESLLINNMDDFSAELNVLNTLLKMDGRK